MLDYLMKRFTEPSTWAGLAAISEGMAQVPGVPYLHGLTLLFGAVAASTRG